MSTATIRVDQQTKRLLAKQARQSKESIGQVVARLARKHLAAKFWEGVAEDYDRAIKDPKTRRGMEREASAIDAASAEAVRPS